MINRAVKLTKITTMTRDSDKPEIDIRGMNIACPSFQMEYEIVVSIA